MSKTPAATRLFYVHDACGMEWVTTMDEVVHITRCPICDTEFTPDSNTLQLTR